MLYLNLPTAYQHTKKGRLAKMIRPAQEKDISRIAEILIFTKRIAYRPIFQNDKVSFGELQVLTLAQEYIAHPQSLKHIWVYEEEFVKGLVTLEIKDTADTNEKTLWIQQLYVDAFFHKQGIGAKLLSFAETMAFAKDAKTLCLWALEKNAAARAFYSKHGFQPSGERRLEEGTPEYLLKYWKTASPA